MRNKSEKNMKNWREIPFFEKEKRKKKKVFLLKILYMYIGNEESCWIKIKSENQAEKKGGAVEKKNLKKTKVSAHK